MQETLICSINNKGKLKSWQNNLIKKAYLARAREVDFTYHFVQGIQSFIGALNITRKAPKVAGTNLKAYKAIGALENGMVEKGVVIHLSKYKTVQIN